MAKTILELLNMLPDTIRDNPTSPAPGSHTLPVILSWIESKLGTLNTEQRQEVVRLLDIYFEKKVVNGTVRYGRPKSISFR